MQPRGTAIARRAPGRFRCLVCQRYVTGTEAGHCPGCGFVPPAALELPDVVEVRPASRALSPLRVLAVMMVGLALVELVRSISL